jgi:hypothetical protein
VSPFFIHSDSPQNQTRRSDHVFSAAFPYDHRFLGWSGGTRGNPAKFRAESYEEEAWWISVSAAGGTRALFLTASSKQSSLAPFFSLFETK